MTGSIRFPHLGITFEHVIQGITIGDFTIACYGIIIALAMVTGIFLVMKVANVTGQNGENYFDLAITAIIAAVICARIYYVIFSWDYYSEHVWEILNFRQGGLAIYGGVLGGAAAVCIFCKFKHMQCLKALDTAVIGLVWGQAAGRWGNFFNREAFGEYTDNLFAMQIPISDLRMSDVTEQMLEHLVETSGGTYIQVHPTFLYESLWNLAVLIILLIVTCKVRIRFDGLILLLYMVFYGSGRFWIEGLRTDQLLIPGTELPVSQVLSVILVVTAAIVLIIKIYLYKRKTRLSTAENV